MLLVLPSLKTNLIEIPLTRAVRTLKRRQEIINVDYSPPEKYGEKKKMNKFDRNKCAWIHTAAQINESINVW